MPKTGPPNRPELPKGAVRLGRYPDEDGLDRDGMLWKRVMAGEPGTVAGVILGTHRHKDGTTFPVEVRLSGVDYGGRRLILTSTLDACRRAC